MSGNYLPSKSLVDKLAGLSKKSSNKHFISRVHQRLRSQNKEAYEPELLSIGPYHHGNPKLQGMEKYKLQYLQRILDRQGGGSPEQFISSLRKDLRKHEEAARDCYEEDISLEPQQFMEMMILDGCFIVEFLRRYNMFDEKEEDHDTIYGKMKDDPIFSKPRHVGSLCRDLLLFENQLPFFILESLFESTKIPKAKEEDHLICCVISCLNHFGIHAESSCNIKPPENEVFHLLGLMYESWFSSRDNQEEKGEHPKRSSAPLKPQLSSEISDQDSSTPRKASLPAAAKQEDLSSRDMQSQTSIARPRSGRSQASSAGPANGEGVTELDTKSQASIDMPSVTESAVVKDLENLKKKVALYVQLCREKTLRLSLKSVSELQEHGIQFESADGSRLEIKFEDAVMKIPTLMFCDHTESLLRNLIAYEEYLLEQGYFSKVVSDYASFMACLLKSPEDAKKLRRREIIRNLWHKDELVSNMFNNIYNDGFLRHVSHWDTSIKVDDHCKKRRICVQLHKWMVELKKIYFNSPWSIIAFLAATFLLLLTVIQTLIAIFQHVQETKVVCNCK